MRIILDISANIHRNDKGLMERIIDGLPIPPDGIRYAIKTQYWRVGNTIVGKENKRTEYRMLRDIRDACRVRGLQWGSSAFDLSSMKTLCHLRPDFVKIACRPRIYSLGKHVPRGIKLFVSINLKHPHKLEYEHIPMGCIPEYPADTSLYATQSCRSYVAISDHTVNDVVFAMKPWKYYECHYCEARDPNNPDAGPFARTNECLKRMFSNIGVNDAEA
jgi:sialic acid synthase SpsE